MMEPAMAAPNNPAAADETDRAPSTNRTAAIGDDLYGRAIVECALTASMSVAPDRRPLRGIAEDLSTSCPCCREGCAGPLHHQVLPAVSGRRRTSCTRRIS